jgi:DNA ligase-1
MQFKLMLAATVEDLDLLRYPLLESPKLDGIRASVQNGILVSRSGKTIKNRYTQHLFAHNKFEGLDGELIVGKPTAPDVFSVTESGITTIAGEPDVRFHVFDKYHPTGQFVDRLALVQTYASDIIAPVPHTRIGNPFDLVVAEKKHLAEGYEGIMFRLPEGLYKQGRSTLAQAWLLKKKIFADAEAVVIGMQEQMHNSNEVTKDALGRAERSSKKVGMVGKGTLGSLLVRGTNGPFKGKEFSIGTGFDDAMKLAMWKDPKTVGKMLTYKYFPKGVVDLPRFPVFLRFRKDL